MKVLRKEVIPWMTSEIRNQPKEKKKQSTKGFETQKRRVGCLVRGAEGQDSGG